MTAVLDSAEPADLAVHAAWVIPVEPDQQILERYCVVVRDGRILTVLPSAEAQRRFDARETIELPSHVLIPGLINAYTHTPSSLLRGLADDHQRSGSSLAETHGISAEFVRDGTELAIACMLRTGTTCFSDAHYFPNVAAETVQHNGLRFCLGMRVADRPSLWASNASEYLAKGTAVRDQYRDHPLLSFAFVPQSAWAMPENLLGEIRTLSDELDVPVQAHLHASAGEMARCLQQYSQRPLQRLATVGLLTPNLNAVHMTQMTDADVAELAGTGVHVIHCPESSLKQARGTCPVIQLLDAGINVALGTDDASANSLDMLSAMRCASLIANSRTADSHVVTAATALRMATLNGARALGLADHTGSLIPGKWADMVAVDLNAPETQPLYDPLAQLVYGASSWHVTEVWVAGAPVLRKGEFTRLDLSDVLRRARAWQTRIAAIAPEVP